MPEYQWVCMLTDYGRDDVFVGVCEGVLARTAPHARVLHLTHAVPPGNVRAGAVLLAQSVGHLPPAVLLAVVDPGVGTARRGVAVLAGESVFVGPDNGLLPWAADAVGGARAAYALTAEALWRQPVAATFHGRDVFAPVAGRLASGLAAAEVGEEVDPAGLVRLPPPVVHVGAGRLAAEVLGVDRFGNVELAATADDLQAAGLAAARRIRLSPPGEPGGAPATVARTFGELSPGEPGLIEDSFGHLALVVNRGSAASMLALSPGAVVELSGDAG